MDDLLPFIIVGVASGSVYGLAAAGLTLTFKTSGIFNFAHGAIAAAAAFCFFELHFVRGIPWPLALAAGVFGFGTLAGLGLELIARRLGAVSPAQRIVGTVGLLLAIQGLLTWRFGFETRTVPNFLPQGSAEISGVRIEAQQVILMVVGVASTTGLYLFFRWSRLGTAMRAMVDDPVLLSVSGTRPSRVRRAAWIIGCWFAALSGILIAPTLGLDAFLLTLLVVQAFGAAAIGRFASLPLAYAGGIGIGVATALAQKFVAGSQVLNGLPPSIPFLVLFLALVAAPPRRTAATAPLRRAVRSRPPGRIPVPAALAGAALVLAVPAFVGPKLPIYISACSTFLIFLSLAILVHESGQISLAHAGFAAVGAATMGHLTTGAGLPWGVALLLAGLSAVPLGLLVALPAIRLAGVYLALATLGLGIFLERVVYGTGVMFGVAGRSAPRPSLPFLETDSDTTFYYVSVAVVAVTAVLMLTVLRSRLGRLLRGLADSPRALVAHGLNVNVARALVFGMSACVGGVAGALTISAAGQANGRGFTYLHSLFFFAVVGLARTRALRSAVVATLLYTVTPPYLPAGLVEHQGLIFGVVALTVVLLEPPIHLPAGVRLRARVQTSARLRCRPHPEDRPVLAS
jgi:branched-subunit amino acid ABC-type transport system permease component